MPGPEFWRTIMGHRLIEGDVPRLIDTLERIAAALERIAGLPPKEKP